MRKTLRVVVLLFVALSAAFFILVPPVVEVTLNRVTSAGAEAPSPEAQELHTNLRIVDLHADSLLWGRNLLKRSTRGAVDVPRLIEGNVALEVFTAVTKTPRGLNYERNDANSDNIFWLALAQRWPPQTWNSLAERALYFARRLQETAAQSQGRFVTIRSSSDLAAYLKRRERDRGITAGMLGIEGAHALEGKPENVDRVYDAGYRYISLTHFFDNEFAGSSAGVVKGGITPLGEQLIRRMNERRIIIDLAHASPETIAMTLKLTKRPVIVSHGGLKGNCNNRRNLSDDEARGVAATGGIIGIGFWPTAVCGDTPRDIVRAIHYAVGVVGIEHVALGSDFDGSVTVPFDVTHLSELTDAMLREGFREEEIHAIMGENALRFFSENLPE